MENFLIISIIMIGWIIAWFFGALYGRSSLRTELWETGEIELARKLDNILTGKRR